MTAALQEVPPPARDVDRLLYRGDVVAIGAWRCPTSHPLFHDSGPIRDHCVTFPRSAAFIVPAGAEPFQADPTVVELYNAGQEYSRHPVSPQGAECDYFAFAPALLEDAGRFRTSHVPADARLYLRQRRLVSSVRAGALADPLQIEESVLSLVDEVLRVGPHAPRAVAPRDSAARRTELADAAARELATSFAEPLPLGALARRLRTSPFHLCRVFRERTGRSLHGYRTELRLRTALERIEDGCDLTTLAHELGFSSHSHFTASFRSAFGVTPSRVTNVRRRIRRRLVRLS